MSQIKGLAGLIKSVRTNFDLLHPSAIIEKLEDLITSVEVFLLYIASFDVDFEDIPTLELEIENISDFKEADFGATVYGGGLSRLSRPRIFIFTRSSRVILSVLLY